MLNIADQIGEMSVELIALIRLAEDKSASGLGTMGEATQLMVSINDLCRKVPNSEALLLETKIKSHTAWIVSGPIAQA